MTIAIASGKGGTGKTLVATSLAWLLSRESDTLLLDLDVEEPNAHLFFDARFVDSQHVSGMIPVIEEEFCTHCGLCQRVCAYHALLVLPDQVVVFPELCKSCNGCLALCPEGAIITGRKSIGVVERRDAGDLRLYSGRLDIGATDAPALIRAVKSHARNANGHVLLDAPPGTACPAVEAVRSADISVLVAEPTPFGLHDLDLMVRTMRKLAQPFVVVANKAVPHDDSLREYCAREGVRMLAEIPYREDIARCCARGGLLPEVLPDTLPLFERILDGILNAEEVRA